MYPNDPYNQTPTGIDYLNQIAPPPEKNGFTMQTKFIIIIITVIGVLSLGFIWLASQSNAGPTVSDTVLTIARLQTVTEAQKKRLRTSNVVDTNSSLDTILTSSLTKGTPIAESEGLDVAKAIRTPGLEAELNKKLDDAYLNAQLDEAYVREMKYHLELLSTDIKTLLKTAKKSDVKDFLEKTLSDITSIKKRLESAEATVSG